MKTNKKIENKQKSSILGDQVKTMANSLREMMEMDLKTIDSETALKNIEALEKESRRIDKEIKRLQKDEKDTEIRSAKSKG
jgi:ATP-dependent Lon protease